MISLFAISLFLQTTAPTLPSESLWQIQGSFEDQNGKKISLAELAGEPALVAMFYASCPRACPMLVSDIKHVLASLTIEEQARLRVVLITLDPSHDTPAVLQEVLRIRGLNPTRTTLLRTNGPATRTLAAALGVRYRPGTGDQGAIDHTSKIVLVDSGGVIQKSREDSSAPVEGLKESIRSVLKRAPLTQAP